MDYKQDKVVTLPTNYFYYTKIITHGTTVGAPPTIIQTTIPITGTATYPNLNYTPLTMSWTGSRQDHWLELGPPSDLWSEFDGNLSVVAGMGGIFYEDRELPYLIANSERATTEFVAVRPQLSRTQLLPDNFVFYGSLSGQWANEPVLNLEELAVGGIAGASADIVGRRIRYVDTRFPRTSRIADPHLLARD